MNRTPKKVLMIASTRANINADKKPGIVTPGTNEPASQTRSAFTTSENRPRVKMVSGRVKSRMTGRIKG
jgi:hypothetical protein